MQKNLTLMLAFLAAALMQFATVQTADAQTTQDGDFIVRLTTGDDVVDLKKEEDCGWSYAQFGPNVTSEFCGDIVWAYDETPDSLVCDTIITQDLTGKIAMVRRGVCNFSLKVYYAQEAGAIAVIVVNHYATATQTGCTVAGMGAGTNAALVTIPSIFVSRNTGEAIQASFDAGEPVSACFLLPRMVDPAGPYHYATPVSQVDSLPNMGVRYTNRDANIQEDVVLKVDITEPGGNLVSLTTTLDTVGVGEEVFSYFPTYLPPAVVGEFTAVYSNNKYTEPRDTLVRTFVHTNYTFATDNLVNDPGGVGTTNANFISGGFVHQEGSLVVTGPDGGVATHISFGISNIDSVFVPNAFPGSTANDIAVFLYDADADDDGTIDLSESFDDLTQIGFGTYTMTGDEVNDAMIDVAITDILTGLPVELEPRHPYYSSLYYNGLEAGYGRDIRFRNSLESWFYLNFPTTPLSIGNGTALTFFDGGWSGADVANRLQMEGFVPGVSVKPEILAETAVAISPNPATEVVRVDLKLAAVSEQVTLTLFDARGQMMLRQTANNIQEGQMSVNVQQVPSGVYLMWVRTAEGSAMRKVVICH